MRSLVITRSHVKFAWPMVAANLVPLVGVIFLDWSAAAILLLYWAETAIVLLIEIVLNARDMGIGRPLRLRIKLKMLGDLISALALVSVFLLTLLAMMITLVAHREWDRLPKSDPASDVIALFASFDLGIPILIVSAMQIYAFRGPDMRKLRQTGPFPIVTFLRVIVIMLVLFLAGGVTRTFGSPYWLLIVIVVVKTAFDIFLKALAEDRLWG